MTSDTLKDKQDSVRLLKKLLERINKTPSNGNNIREQAGKLLNDIDNLIEDQRVDKLFDVKRVKRAARSKALEEYVFAQQTLSKILEAANSVSSSTNDSDAGSEYCARESTVSSDATREAPIHPRPTSTARVDYLVSANINDLIDTQGLTSEWIVPGGGLSYLAQFFKRRNQSF